MGDVRYIHVNINIVVNATQNNTSRCQLPCQGKDDPGTICYPHQNYTVAPLCTYDPVIAESTNDTIYAMTERKNHNRTRIYYKKRIVAANHT